MGTILVSIAADLRAFEHLTDDSTESDIAGGNNFKSPIGTSWSTILLRTGVYQGGTPAHKPTTIANDVYDAVQWALERENWKKPLPSR